MFTMRLDHLSQIDRAHDIDVVQDERVTQRRVAKKPGCFLQASAGIEQRFLARNLNAHSKIPLRVKVVDKLVCEVVHIHDDLGNAELAQPAESNLEQSSTSDFNQSFRAIAGEGTQTRA